MSDKISESGNRKLSAEESLLHAGDEPRRRRSSSSSSSSCMDTSYEPKTLRKTDDCMVSSDASTALVTKVLVLYSGGTIGMVRDENGILRPEPQVLEKRLRSFPQLHDAAYASANFSEAEKQPLILPRTGDPHRVVYTIFEYHPLLDSSNATMDDWIRIALDIKEYYEQFDGFVVLHGTDTMAYTASALSFMLENLGKSVIITGSQIPIFEARSDGRENLLNSLVVAGNYIIPEVTLLFNNKLYRGNRTSKVSASDLDAFASPNMQPLATIGVNIDVNWKLVFQQSGLEKFRVHSKLNRNVGLLRLFPSITVEVVRAFLTPPIQGVVLQTYGAGNGPTSRRDLLDEIKRASLRGILILNCSQCAQGRVDATYETGNLLCDAGVIPGSDMTPEAALTKLSYVLSKTEWSLCVKKQMLQANLRGELTVAKHTKLDDLDLITAIAKTMQISSAEELESLQTALYPSILCSITAKGDLEKLEVMRQFGAYLSACDYDFRTPLHIAASEGNVQVVEYLLRKGASVHMRDRDHNTPLMSAVIWDQHEVIKLLTKAGAHISLTPTQLGDALCTAARNGNVKRLQSFLLAGASLLETDATKRTCMHVACEANQENVLRFLLDSGIHVQSKDLYGHTPKEVAELLSHQHLASLIDSTYVSSSSSSSVNSSYSP
ncbi:L-asparaginase-like isoform X2 [Ornithodoros turicata]|uniref:L-asparaginase-like isoform X2 n=1 Tax=Ornithodoros turicata TaxID=34597 RepID=UPI00313A134D